MNNEIIKDFTAAYGITERDIIHFAGGFEWSDGTVYEYQKQGKAYLLKILKPSENDRYAFERTSERMKYLHYLGSNGVLIVNPIPSVNGELIVKTETEAGNAIGYAWEKIEGEHFKGKTADSLATHYFNWGKTIGSIHRLAKAYPDWQHSNTTDASGLPLISRKAEFDVFYNWLQDEEIKGIWCEIYEKMSLLPVNRDNFGFIHNDLHSANLLINSKGAYALDFDVSNFLWFIMDLAIAGYSEFNHLKQCKLQGVFTDYQKSVMISLLQGYNTENKLPPEEFEHLDMFFAYRRIIMFAVFYNEIKQNAPDYLEQFKNRIIKKEMILHQKIF